MQKVDDPFLQLPAHNTIINGYRLHYIDVGQGTPVVMLHGNPTWSYYYRNLITALKKSYRCIVPDHIGMGLSEHSQDYSYSVEQRVLDFSAFIQSLNLETPIDLVCHDWGGVIGMAYATQHPQHIRKIVLLNTAAFLVPDTKKLPWQLKLARIPFVGAFLLKGLNVFVLGVLKTGIVSYKPTTIEKNMYCLPYASWQKRHGIWKFVQEIPLQKSDANYALIEKIETHLDRLKDKPILLVWGLKDFVFDKDFLIRWQEIFPHAKVKSFENAGHLVLEDAAFVCDDIRNFLS
jgi:haloalkane dehalogenase